MSVFGILVREGEGEGEGERGGGARPWNEGSESGRAPGTKSNSKRLDGAMQQVIVCT